MKLLAKYIISVTVILFTGLFVFLYFQGTLLAESTFVLSNSDTAGIISNTKYMEGSPVIIFSEQLNFKKSEILNNVENFVFLDCSYQDLAIDLSNPLVVTNNYLKFKIKEAAILEFFTQYFHAERIENEIFNYEVFLNNKIEFMGSVLLSDQLMRKYNKISELKLKPGTYKIKIKIKDGRKRRVKNKYLSMLIVNSAVRTKEENKLKMILNNPLRETGYIFKENKREFYTK